MKQRIRCTATSGKKSHCRRLFTDGPNIDLSSHPTPNMGSPTAPPPTQCLPDQSIEAIISTSCRHQCGRTHQHYCPCQHHVNNHRIIQVINRQDTEVTYQYNRAPHYMFKQPPAHIAAAAWGMCVQCKWGPCARCVINRLSQSASHTQGSHAHRYRQSGCSAAFTAEYSYNRPTTGLPNRSTANQSAASYTKTLSYEQQVLQELQIQQVNQCYIRSVLSVLRVACFLAAEAATRQANKQQCRGDSTY